MNLHLSRSHGDRSGATDLATLSLQAVNVVQLFTVDSDVNADSICVVGHQFSLLCTTFRAKGRRGLIQAIHQGG